MNMLLSFTSPLEFLLRYTVIAGIIIAIIGAAVLFSAKRVTMYVRKQETINKQDKLYTILVLVGVSLIMIGLVCTALPISNTLYVG